MSININNTDKTGIVFNGKRYCTVYKDGYIYFRDKTIPKMFPLGGRIYYVNSAITGATYTFYDETRKEISLTEEEKLDVSKLGKAMYWSVSGLDTSAGKYYIVATTDGRPTSSIRLSGTMKMWPSNYDTIGATNYNDGKYNTEIGYNRAVELGYTSQTFMFTDWYNWNKTRPGWCDDWFIPAVNQFDTLIKSGVYVDSYNMWSSTEDGQWCRSWTNYGASYRRWYGMNKGGNNYRWLAVRYTDSKISLLPVGGRIYYDDGDNGATYRFYDSEYNELTYDGTINSVKNAVYYQVTGTPTKKRFYIYNNTVGLVGSKIYGNVYSGIQGATDQSIGSGYRNTIIMSHISTQSDSIFTYAKTLNTNKSGGCNDWFVPSCLEQQKLYESGVTGGYSAYYWWSSTETTTNSWRAYIWNYGIKDYQKDYHTNVVYIRSI